MGVNPGIPSNNALSAMIKHTFVQAARQFARSEAAEQLLLDLIPPQNPWARKRKRSKKDLAQRAMQVRMGVKSGDKEADSRANAKGKLEQKAQEAARKNPELPSRLLINIRSQLREGMDPEQIMKMLQDALRDPWLQDECLEFLLNTTADDSELHESLNKAKEQHKERYEREIRIGKNISEEAREFADKAQLGSPTALREMYRDITRNPREATVLFDELSDLFDFEKLESAVSFFLSSLGADLRSSGSSIPKGQLYQLMTEGRSLEAILGVYYFFQGRMDLLASLFAKEGLHFPSGLSFEVLAKKYMIFLKERYPSPDKLARMARELKISSDILMEILVFSQWRDAVRSVAMKLYRSLVHRDDVFAAIIEYLEEKEEEREEEDDDEDSWFDDDEDDREA